MPAPRIVRQTPVKHGDEWTLTVSTIKTGFRAYTTAVFDDTPDRRLVGWLLGERTIETTVETASTREEAMEQHREAVYAARTETPKNSALPDELRYEVRELGPHSFVVHDTVSQLDYDASFTRRAAQTAADRRNARDWDETPAEAARYDRYHFDRDED